MRKKSLCESCIYFHSYKIDLYKNYGLYRVFDRIETAYKCNKLKIAINILRRTCKYYIALSQKTLNGGDIKLVKLANIEVAEESSLVQRQRLDLRNLPNELILKATNEKVTESKPNVSGGLTLVFDIKDDDRVLIQKYTKMSAVPLVEACKELGIEDTKQLQDNWYKYKKTPMRMGFDRMIPYELFLE